MSETQHTMNRQQLNPFITTYNQASPTAKLPIIKSDELFDALLETVTRPSIPNLLRSWTAICEDWFEKEGIGCPTIDFLKPQPSLFELRQQLTDAVNQAVFNAGLSGERHAFKAINHDIKAKFGERQYMTAEQLYSAIDFAATYQFQIQDPAQRIRDYFASQQLTTA